MCVCVFVCVCERVHKSTIETPWLNTKPNSLACTAYTYDSRRFKVSKKASNGSDTFNDFRCTSVSSMTWERKGKQAQTVQELHHGHCPRTECACFEHRLASPLYRVRQCSGLPSCGRPHHRSSFPSETTTTTMTPQQAPLVRTRMKTHTLSGETTTQAQKTTLRRCPTTVWARTRSICARGFSRTQVTRYSHILNLTVYINSNE